MSLSKDKGSKDRAQTRNEDPTTYSYDSPAFNGKKGIGFGAWGGFIGAIVLTGIMLIAPLILGLAVGSFLYAFGSNILPGSSLDQVTPSLVAFSLILLQGILVGAIFGAITSKVNRLHPSKKGKGVSMGLIAGLITYIVIFLPIMLTIFPAWLSNALVTFPALKLGVFGASNYDNTVSAISNAKNYYNDVIVAMGIIAFLVYGAIMGGIVTLCYSVFHFASSRGAQYRDNAKQANSKGQGYVDLDNSQTKRRE